jgi:hypothetical protein
MARGELLFGLRTHRSGIHDEPADAEIAALTDNQRVDRLLAARGCTDGDLVEINRGYWGDMNLSWGTQPIQPGPGAWTKVGSPEWLADLFPGWNEGAAA